MENPFLMSIWPHIEIKRLVTCDKPSLDNILGSCADNKGMAINGYKLVDCA